MELETLRKGWQNAFYRGTACYVAVLVTLIFSLQVFRYFFDLPSDEVQCDSCCASSTDIPNGQE